MTEKEVTKKSTDISFSLMYHPIVGSMTHIGWGEKGLSTTTGRMFPLGFDYGRNSRTPKRGFRRAVYDFCFGYVSGFPVKDILWYVGTRSLNYRKRPKYLKVYEEQFVKSQGL